MTSSDLQSTTNRKTWISRLVEWFWRGAALQQLQSSSSGEPHGGESKEVSRDRLWFERVLRLGSLALASVVLSVVLSWWAEASEAGRDLARGRAWQASSTYGSEGCKSPAQQCRSEFFFSTKEQNEPWLQIDLGGERTFSEVRIFNRSDCCGERAVPLILEVRGGDAPFREIARQTEAFDTWVATFPALSARYIRLRVARRSYLHLKRVLVLP